MDYKAYYISTYETLIRVKNMLNQMDTNYFTTTIINNKPLNNDTISIVMTASNRSIQTYFTLDTINKSSYKNIQVILVDDSSDDPITIAKLNQYNMHIELIQIKNKFWINPCVNYNIGFKHVKGGKIIIQNAEVCHIGDVIQHVADTVENNNYYAFDVYAIRTINENNQLYDMEKLNTMVRQNIISLAGMWYQHPIHRNEAFHFLTSMTKHTFDKIEGFDIDYAMGVDYDDADFLCRIRNNGIKIITITDTVMGVHQWHRQSPFGSHGGKISNSHIFSRKLNYINTNKSLLCLASYEKNDVVDIINKWI